MRGDGRDLRGRRRHRRGWRVSVARWMGRFGSDETAVQGTLAGVAPGERVRVRDVDGAGPLVQRLMLLGVLPGTELVFLRRAPAGDPVEVRVHGASLSLRMAEARAILVEPVR